MPLLPQLAPMEVLGLLLLSREAQSLVAAVVVEEDELQVLALAVVRAVVVLVARARAAMVRRIRVVVAGEVATTPWVLRMLVVLAVRAL